MSFQEAFYANLNPIIDFPGRPFTPVRAHYTHCFCCLIKPVSFPKSVPIVPDKQFCSVKSSLTYTFPCSFFGEVCVTIYYKSNTCNLRKEIQTTQEDVPTKQEESTAFCNHPKSSSQREPVSISLMRMLLDLSVQMQSCAFSKTELHVLYYSTKGPVPIGTNLSFSFFS